MNLKCVFWYLAPFSWIYRTGCNKIESNQEMEMDLERSKWKSLEKQREVLKNDIRRLQEKISQVDTTMNKLNTSLEDQMNNITKNGSKLENLLSSYKETGKIPQNIQKVLDESRKLAEKSFASGIDQMKENEIFMESFWNLEKFNLAFIFFMKKHYLTPNQEKVNIFNWDDDQNSQFKSILTYRNALIKAKTNRIQEIKMILMEILGSAKQIDSAIRNSQETLASIEATIPDRDFIFNDGMEISKSEKYLIKKFFEGQKEDLLGQINSERQQAAIGLKSAVEKDWQVENGIRLNLRLGKSEYVSEDVTKENPKAIPESLIKLGMVSSNYESQIAAKTKAISETKTAIINEYQLGDPNSYILNWYAGFIVRSRNFYEKSSSKVADRPISFYQDLMNSLFPRKVIE